MAVLRVCLTLLLTLLLGSAGASAADPQTEAPPGLFDRPVLVVDPGMHTGIIKRASADKDGRWAVTGSDDKTIRIWSLADGAPVRTIRLPAGPGNVGKVLPWPSARTARWSPPADSPGRLVSRNRFTCSTALPGRSCGGSRACRTLWATSPSRRTARVWPPCLLAAGD
jgi:hypothetical protein